MQALISVLIPVYNVEKHIEKSLLSLFNNTYADKCEFIITDDCSTDNSINIAHSVLQKFPNLSEKVIFQSHDKNRGLAAARNAGIQRATGKYILNVDSDDFVEHNFLEEFYNVALKLDADIITCGYFMDYPEKSSKVNYEFVNDSIKSLQNLINDNYKAFLWCKLFKRDIILKNNIHWTEGINMLEDFTFCAQYFPHAKKISSIDKCLYHYVQRDNSYVHQMYTEKKVLNFIDALNFSEQTLLGFYGQTKYDEYFKELMNQRKILTKYHTLLEGSLYLQKKYYNIWPETYSSIDKSNFGRLTKCAMRRCIKAKHFPFFIVFLNSLVLILRKHTTLKQYLLRY